MPTKQGKTSQDYSWPRYRDWPPIGPTIAIEHGKNTPKGQMVPFSRSDTPEILHFHRERVHLKVRERPYPEKEPEWGLGASTDNLLKAFLNPRKLQPFFLGTQCGISDFEMHCTLCNSRIWVRLWGWGATGFLKTAQLFPMSLTLSIGGACVPYIGLTTGVGNTSQEGRKGGLPDRVGWS